MKEGGDTRGSDGRRVEGGGGRALSNSFTQRQPIYLLLISTYKVISIPRQRRAARKWEGAEKKEEGRAREEVARETNEEREGDKRGEGGRRRSRRQGRKRLRGRAGR
eukprot:566051-Rhodomonas_salina.1